MEDELIFSVREKMRIFDIDMNDWILDQKSDLNRLQEKHKLAMYKRTGTSWSLVSHGENQFE